MPSILELQLSALKKSILELQLQALQKAEKKRNNNKMMSDHSHCEETRSRSRLKTRKTKSKTAKIKQKIIQRKVERDITISSIGTQHQQKQNQLQAEQITLCFLPQHQLTNNQFLIECAKLVQANTVLAHLITQAATQKYQLQERIVAKMRQIDKLQRRLSGCYKEGESRA